MKISKVLIAKAKYIRKQNWSAPTTMGVFIIICMIIVFSFESLGLANKEKNLEFRHTTPEKIIRTVSVDKFKTESTESKFDGSAESSQALLIEKLKMINERNKEESMEKMLKILVSGALQQNQYTNHEINHIPHEQEFFDF